MHKQTHRTYEQTLNADMHECTTQAWQHIMAPLSHITTLIQVRKSKTIHNCQSFAMIGPVKSHSTQAKLHILSLLQTAVLFKKKIFGRQLKKQGTTLHTRQQALQGPQQPALFLPREMRQRALNSLNRSLPKPLHLWRGRLELLCLLCRLWLSNRWRACMYWCLHFYH